MIDPPYADASALVAQAFEAFRPPRRVTVADYAAENRWLANSGGGFVGRWSHAEAPYLVEPMEALTGTDFLTVAVVGPGQSAKTSIAENWLLQSVGCDPGNLLWYMQTDTSVQAYVKQRIDPMIRSHEVLTSRLGKRPIDNSLSFKSFGTMAIEFLPATPSTLINKSAPRIVADEIDAYPEGLGDVKAQLDLRRQTFGRDSKLLAISHADRARSMRPSGWTAGIMALYADSDRRLWWWRCAECGCWSSPHPLASRHMAIDYPALARDGHGGDAPLDEIQDAARLICPVHGCVLEDWQRRSMNLSGRWIGEGQTIDEDGTVSGELIRRDTAGFWIVGAQSLFVLGGIGALARARVKAEREFAASKDDRTLRQVMVKQWGLVFECNYRPGKIDAGAIADRAEAFALETVPLGVRYLTAAVDIQVNRFEVLIRGWGDASESWIVARRVVIAETATNPGDWDALLDGLAAERVPLADGSGRGMAIRAIGWDSGGAPGTTSQAYAAWRRMRARRLAKPLGKIGGRDAWTMLPLKGGQGINAGRLSVVYPDSTRRDRSAASRGEVPLGVFSANQFKDDLAGQLATGDAGAGYVHFPKALRSAEPPHAWFEQLVAEDRRDNGAWVKANTAIRNEALDLMVMTHVMAHLFGLARINWAKPPMWAAEWDTNSMVGPMTVAGSVPAGTPHAAVVAASPAANPAARRSSMISRMA